MAWRYTVAVPQYIQNKDKEGELVTLFRVNVLLQAPDASSEDLLAKPPFFVLRRFSQFRQLFEQDLLGRRREELERWLWKLIATPEVARSSQLKAFLEFDKAMQRALQQRMASGYAGSTTPSALTSPISSLHNWRANRGSAASSEAGDFDDQRSEASYATATTATNTPRASAAGASGLQSMEQVSNQLQHSTGPDARRGVPPLISSPGLALGSSGAGPVSNRLALPLEQRGDVRRLLDLLQRRVDQGGKDLRGAVAEVTLLEETNRLLAGRLSEVQFQLEGGKSTREVELENEAAEAKKQMAAMSSTISGLQGVAAGVDSHRTALHESQLSASELSARLAELTSTSTSRLQMLNQQVSTLQVQLDESHQEKRELLARMQEWELSPSKNHLASAHTSPRTSPRLNGTAGTTQASNILDNSSSGTTPAPSLTSGAQDSSMEALNAALASSSRLREALELELQACKAGMLADREKARADQIVLAKEIKRLRGEISSVQSSSASQLSAALLASSGAAAVREEGMLAQLQALDSRCAQLVQEQLASAAAVAENKASSAAAAAAQALAMGSAAELEAISVTAITAATTRAEAAEQRLLLAEAQLVTASQQVSVMQARCDALAAEVSLASNSMQESSQVYLSTLSEQSALLDQATCKTDASEAVASELAARVTALDTLLAAAQATASSSNTVIDTLAAQNAALDAQLSAIQVTANTTTADLAAQVASLQASLEASQSTHSVSDTITADLRLQIMALSANQSAHSDSNNITSDFKQQIRALETAMSTSDTAMAELREQVTALKSSLEESRTECLCLRETGEALEQQIFQLQQAGENLQREALKASTHHLNGHCMVSEIPLAAALLPALDSVNQDTSSQQTTSHDTVSQDMAAEFLLLQHRTVELESLLESSQSEAREIESLRMQLSAAQATLANINQAEPIPLTASTATSDKLSMRSNGNSSPLPDTCPRGAPHTPENGHVVPTDQGSPQDSEGDILTYTYPGDSAVSTRHMSQANTALRKSGDGGHGELDALSMLPAGAEGAFLLRASQQQQELQAANAELALRVAQLQELGSANAELASQVALLQESLQRRQQEDHHQYELSSLPSSPTLRPRPAVPSSLQEADRLLSSNNQNAAELAQVCNILLDIDSGASGSVSDQQQQQQLLANPPALSELSLLQNRIQDLEAQLQASTKQQQQQQQQQPQSEAHHTEVKIDNIQGFTSGPSCTDPSHPLLHQQLVSTSAMIIDLQDQLAALEAQLAATTCERTSLTAQLESLRYEQQQQELKTAQTISDATASLQAAADRQQRELQLEHDSLMAVAANQRVQLQQELAGARFELSTSRLVRPPAPIATSAASHFSSPFTSPAAGNTGDRFGAQSAVQGDDLGDLLSFEGMDVSPQILYVPPPPPGPPPLLELEPDYPQRPVLQLVQRENDTLHRHLSELQRRFDELSQQTGSSRLSSDAVSGSGAPHQSGVLPLPPPPPPPPPMTTTQPTVQLLAQSTPVEPSSCVHMSDVVLTLVQSVEAVILEARALLTLLNQSNADALASAAVNPSPSALDAFLAAQSAVTTSMHTIMATAKSELGVLPLMPSLPEGLDSASVQSMNSMEASLRTLLADALQLSCQACLRANELTCDKFLGQVFPSANPPPPPAPPPPSNNTSAGQPSSNFGTWPTSQQSQQQPQRQQSSNEAQQGTSLWGVANNTPPSRKPPPPPQATGYGPPAQITYDPFTLSSSGGSNTSDGSGLNVRNVFNRMMGSSPTPQAPTSSQAPHTVQQPYSYPFQPAPSTNPANSAYAPPGFTAPTAPPPALQSNVRGGPHVNGGGSGNSGQATALSASGQLQPLPNPNVLGGLSQRMSDAVHSLGLGNTPARSPTADGWGLPGGAGPGPAETRRW